MPDLEALQAGIIGDRFWELAKGILIRQGLAHADAAALLDCHKSRISQLVVAGNNPTEATMVEFAETFGFHLYLVAVPVHA